jgi:hypothetical protein
MMDYGSLPAWLSAVGSTGAVTAALIIVRGEGQRARRAETLLATRAAAQVSTIREHFLTIIEGAVKATEQALETFSIEQEDAAYYEQYDLLRAALGSTMSRLQRLTSFPGLPLDIYLASDELIALLGSRQLTEPLDESVIIAIKDLDAQLSRVRGAARA